MKLTEEDVLANEIRDIYNSGDCKRAVELACTLLKRFPDSYRAKYSYAVMHGDYSYSSAHSAEEKNCLLEIAKKGVSDLLTNPSFQTWPQRFQYSVRNEYYWFFELPEKQYDLGIEILQTGPEGNYPACVGASMVALKMLKQGKIPAAEEWARTSLTHFSEFEKVSPDWYNINHFAAQALACLGQSDEAVKCFKDMYRKQKAPEKSDEILEFARKLDEILRLRKS